ncbi:cache domain-containing protein [Flexithrix dorotheae]|uniref:cache domain-containing protein n=1 Tax=Flexithrix dorotheae TaxID=70993 RepID=UPI00036799F4|nr:cache domain-containing protein [Flexithrix dorotheae]
MNLKKQVTLFISSSLIITVVVISSIAIYNIKAKGVDDIEEYKHEQTLKAKNHLKSLVDIAYSSINANYQHLNDDQFLERYYGKHLKSNLDLVEAIINDKARLAREGILSKPEAQRETVKLIKGLRYDNGEGYFWITDNTDPIPNMVMHPTMTNLEGRSLDDPRFEVAGSNNRNLFEVAREITEANGEGFFSYKWTKPDEENTDKHTKKFSYVRAIPKWDWIFGTGVFVEDAKENVINGLLGDLELLKFDEGNSYFWITTDSLPHPTVIMHGKYPEWKGRILTGNELDSVKTENEESLFVSQINASKSEKLKGFINYEEGNDTGVTEKKLSYSKRFEPYGWVISTSIGTDEIEEKVAKKAELITSQINNMVLLIGIGAIIILIAGLLLANYFTSKLTIAIAKVKDTLRALAAGKAVNKLHSKRKDEIGEMTNSLDALIDGVSSYSKVAREIGNQNYGFEFQPLSKEDVLGNELLNMRDNLQKAAKEEEIRHWQTEGSAKFGELLRKFNKSLEELSDEFLKNLVNYLNLNQGAVFILTESAEQQKALEMIACYAYDRKKYLHKRIRLGEGLAGQCFLEKKEIYLKEIPDNYLNIRSGLGDASPRNILVIPLMINEEILGVIEIASFNLLKAHEIAFVEKVCTMLAANISTVTSNERTKQLLENSQKMTEQLRAQEEELRQNQEEMQATQEEMYRRQAEVERENEILKNELEATKEK